MFCQDVNYDAVFYHVSNYVCFLVAHALVYAVHQILSSLCTVNISRAQLTKYLVVYAVRICLQIVVLKLRIQRELASP